MTTVFVCVTCKKRASDALGGAIIDAHAGEKLHERLEKLAQSVEQNSNALNDDVRNVRAHFDVVPVKCLSACKRGPTMAVQSDQKFSYIFGDMDSASNEDIASCLSAYNKDERGALPKMARPESMRSSVIGRVPPLNFKS